MRDLRNREKLLPEEVELLTQKFDWNEIEKFAWVLHEFVKIRKRVNKPFCRHCGGPCKNKRILPLIVS